jgi:hypothetical protein
MSIGKVAAGVNAGASTVYMMSGPPMTYNNGRKVLGMRQSALGSRTTTPAKSLILRSTIIQQHFRGSSPLRPPFEKLLLKHCQRIVASGRSRELIVQLELRLEGICPTTHEKSVLRVADELLSNTMEHGFYGRQRGHVLVHVVSRASFGVQVSVSDDGWGFDSRAVIDGNGFRLLRQIGGVFLGAAAGPFVATTTVAVVIPF